MKSRKVIPQDFQKDTSNLLSNLLRYWLTTRFKNTFIQNTFKHQHEALLVVRAPYKPNR